MTYKTDCTLLDELLEQIADQGLDVLPELIRTVINTAMQIEWQCNDFSSNWTRPKVLEEL
ncbi:MAG TPA: hypothetical protein VFI27_20275 [candidate division Zixibacteria bacterium]|nr:hypothetical protein [candidate division Zixibacteria bacterium]